MISDALAGNFFNKDYKAAELIRIPVPKGESITVKSAAMLAFTNLEMKTELQDTVFSLIFSGEGTVNEVSGNGQILVGSSDNTSSGVSSQVMRAVVSNFFPSLKTIQNFTIAAVAYHLAQTRFGTVEQQHG